MNNIVPTSDNMAALMERVLIEGDLSKLSPPERMTYYSQVCRSAGLNPLTKPFAYITLNSKLQLYALKACTDQLRFVHQISVVEITNKTVSDVYVVTAKVSNASGRTDADDGAVNIGNIKGEALANAMMKATTKAKRRATLSICGLGFLDESEVDSIPGAVNGEPPSPPPASQQPKQITAMSPPPAPPSPPPAAQTAPAAPPAAPPAHDPKTGEVGPRALAVPTKAGKENWVAWGKEFIAAIMGAQSHDEIDAWLFANQETLGRCGQDGPKAAGSIQKATAKRSNELLEGEKKPAPTPLRAETGTPAADYTDWKGDVLAELAACMSEQAVEDLRDRVLPDMFPPDRQEFKDKCAEKMAEIFRKK